MHESQPALIVAVKGQSCTGSPDAEDGVQGPVGRGTHDERLGADVGFHVSARLGAIDIRSRVKDVRDVEELEGRTALTWLVTPPGL